jgi:hypothetical protein
VGATVKHDLDHLIGAIQTIEDTISITINIVIVLALEADLDQDIVIGAQKDMLRDIQILDT